MAEGRMVNRSVATDDRLNGMSRDAMLLFLMTIPHLDRDGLIDGRPRVLWATVAPLQDVWIERVAGLVEEWLATGMVVRYCDDAGQPILFFTGFAWNQRHMRYDRERASSFPCPPGFARTPAGLRPAGAVPPAAEPLPPDQGRSGAGAAPDNGGRSAGAGPAEGASAAADKGGRSAGAGPAEDQDQDQTEDQDQDQTEVEDQHQHQAQTELVDDDDLPASALPRAFGSGTLVTGSAGDLVASFSLEELRAAALQLGSLLNLHAEWMGYVDFVARREAGTLSILIEWIELYRALPLAALEKIDNLPGLIRSHLNKGERAALTGGQRRALVAAVIEALAAVEAGARAGP